MEKIPYRQGQPEPGPEYILAQLVDDDGTLRLFWVLAKELISGEKGILETGSRGDSAETNGGAPQ